VFFFFVLTLKVNGVLFSVTESHTGLVNMSTFSFGFNYTPLKREKRSLTDLH